MNGWESVKCVTKLLPKYKVFHCGSRENVMTEANPMTVPGWMNELCCVLLRRYNAVVKRRSDSCLLLC